MNVLNIEQCKANTLIECIRNYKNYKGKIIFNQGNTYETIEELYYNDRDEGTTYLYVKVDGKYKHLADDYFNPFNTWEFRRYFIVIHSPHNYTSNVCRYQKIVDQEERIVWLDNPLQFPYLREHMIEAPTRQQGSAKTLWKGCGRVVGYSVLKKDAEKADNNSSQYIRRIWWIKENDFYEYPLEAVDVHSIDAGKLSKRML